jgi:class 3 adenylate cyclase
MTFEEMLDQAIDMLRRRGRLTYRALQLQLNLNDEYLDVLKDELIYGQQLAVDEEGKVLVWIGDSAPTLVAPPTSFQPTEASATAPDTPEAERRQLTVMFCDLVDSTTLSSQLDPEDYRQVVRAYQEVGAAVVKRYDGHIAQYLGDALLVYFGYPRAHEDDAQRALRAGLDLIEAMDPLNTELAQKHEVNLAARVGIHTGLVVMGEIGSGEHMESLALGETPNVASRLQGLAKPNTVVISAATTRLVQGYFTLEALGAQTLRGLAEPMAVYRVRGASEAQTRFEVATRRGLTPLVGRENEVALLQERWKLSKAEQGQVVLLSGEGGIGKSRLVEVLREQVAGEGSPLIAFRCAPDFVNSSLYPVIAYVQRLLQLQRDDTPEARMDKLEQGLRTYGFALDDIVPLFAPLLSVPFLEHYQPLQVTSQRQRQLTMEALVQWLLAEAVRQPVLLVVEDLHWADPSTLELVSLLIEHISTAQMLTLLTFRPEFCPPWATAAHLTHLTLNRLTPQHIERMATYVANGKPLRAEVIEQVVRQTDGIPLFVEELTKSVLESGVLEAQEDRYGLSGSLPALGIPATLQDVLMARLDRLGTAKGVAQLGATLGRTFEYEVLQAISPVDAPSSASTKTTTSGGPVERRWARPPRQALPYP